MSPGVLPLIAVVVTTRFAFGPVDPLRIALTGIRLAVAAVAEGLPTMVTPALELGVAVAPTIGIASGWGGKNYVSEKTGDRLSPGSDTLSPAEAAGDDRLLGSAEVDHSRSVPCSSISPFTIRVEEMRSPSSART